MYYVPSVGGCMNKYFWELLLLIGTYQTNCYYSTIIKSVHKLITTLHTLGTYSLLRLFSVKLSYT